MARESITNALTIDFEDWYQGLEIPHTEWHGFEDRIAVVGRKLLRILDEGGMKATFFVLGFVAEQHPELVKEIDKAGHEVGTHGFSHTLIYKQSPQVFRGEMERAIGSLEELTGKKVIGHRAPFFSITKKSLWALDILGELGIRYDSSIFPVLNYRYGIADAYEQLKAFSRGKRLDAQELKAFIDQLKIPEADKNRLKNLSPTTYTGCAVELLNKLI